MNAATQRVTIPKARLDLYKAALKRAMRRVAAYRRRRRGPIRYALKPWDRMHTQRFNPSFLFPGDLPSGLKVLVVLPHHHEAAKLGGLLRMLLTGTAGAAPRNTVHAVVVLPSHRSVRATPTFAKREAIIDAVNKEALDWAHLIGLDLGVPPWNSQRRLNDPAADLPPETAYVRRRVGDQFVYGPDGAYRFFNAWRTYDSGERDPNRQEVDAADQREFNALLREEAPDLVLLPDILDSHPSHRTTRTLAMEALRQCLADRHRQGEPRDVTLMEYASFNLLTPPRYNLWVLAPKELTRMKSEANKVFRLQQQHDYEMDQIMAERVISMAAGDEFCFTRDHPEKSGFARRLSECAPGQLPANITAESFTMSTLRVVIRRGFPVVKETRVPDPRLQFQSMGAGRTAIPPDGMHAPAR